MNYENHEIYITPLKNHENHKNLSIPLQNYENQEVHKIQCNNIENNENLIIPLQNHENHEVLRIHSQDNFKKLKINYSIPELRKS